MLRSWCYEAHQWRGSFNFSTYQVIGRWKKLMQLLWAVVQCDSEEDKQSLHSSSWLESYYFEEVRPEKLLKQTVCMETSTQNSSEFCKQNDYYQRK